MLLLMLAASAAFGWWGINYRSSKRQEAVIAGFAAFQPGVQWAGYDVFDLDFSQCKTQPGDDDLIYVGELHGMWSLNLAGSSVTDAGLKHLYGLTRLRSVYLYGTKVTQRGVDALHRALPNTHIGWSPGSVGPRALTAPPPSAPPPPPTPPPPANTPNNQ